MVAAAVAVVFALTFMPIPIEIETTPDAPAQGATDAASLESAPTPTGDGATGG